MIPGLGTLKVAAVVAVIAGVGGAWSGHKITSNAWKADLVEVQQKHAELLAAELARTNDLSSQLENERGKIRTVYKTITKKVDRIIDRPVYVGQCFDADGLQLANDALAGQASDSGQPAPAVPAPIPLRGRDRSVGAAKAD